MSKRETTLLSYYNAMSAHFGPCGWWPGDTPFEVAVGAILTQNTAWRNVEKALAGLKNAGLLAPLPMWLAPTQTLENAIRPSGSFRVKTQRLRAFLSFLAGLAGAKDPPADLHFESLRDYDTLRLREELLTVKGIGPETADSILLYALGRPTFVVDAYTKRIFSRHGLVEEEIGYAGLREFFMEALPEDTALYNEYHALLVKVGNGFCRRQKPLCGGCPLRDFLEYEVDS